MRNKTISDLKKPIRRSNKDRKIIENIISTEMKDQSFEYPVAKLSLFAKILFDLRVLTVKANQDLNPKIRILNPLTWVIVPIWIGFIMTRHIITKIIDIYKYILLQIVFW